MVLETENVGVNRWLALFSNQYYWLFQTYNKREIPSRRIHITDFQKPLRKLSKGIKDQLLDREANGNG
jgi:hypothetical protein